MTYTYSRTLLLCSFSLLGTAFGVSFVTIFEDPPLSRVVLCREISYLLVAWQIFPLGHSRLSVIWLSSPVILCFDPQAVVGCSSSIWSINWKLSAFSRAILVSPVRLSVWPSCLAFLNRNAVALSFCYWIYLGLNSVCNGLGGVLPSVDQTIYL